LKEQFPFPAGILKQSTEEAKKKLHLHEIREMVWYRALRCEKHSASLGRSVKGNSGRQGG